MQKLGTKALFIESERNYYRHHSTYYKNIRLLGLEYPDLDYSKALPFLQMLPDAVFKRDAYANDTNSLISWNNLSLI